MTTQDQWESFSYSESLKSIEKGKGTPLHVISELLQDGLGTSDTSLGEQWQWPDTDALTSAVGPIVSPRKWTTVQAETPRVPHCRGARTATPPARRGIL